MNTQENTQKLCECGCGQPAPISQKTDTKRGYVIGMPRRFVVGHQARVQPTRTLANRFWTKVSKRDLDDCWLWTGATNSQGYGQMQRGSRGEGRIAAHRLSYELHYGQIPEGKEVCHACDNPACCNPNHLWLGTHQENMQDSRNKGRNFTSGEQRPRGEKNPHALLTVAQVREIRLLCKKGVPRREIAKQFGIAKSTVTAIFLRVNWKHIE